MSIAVAVKKGEEIVIASDTMDSFGSSTVSPENYTSKKIVQIGSSYVASTGWGLYEDILDDYLQTTKDVVLDTKPRIFSFLMQFWKDLHEKYNLVKDQTSEDEDSPFGGLDSTFLIANSNGIFYVSSNMSVTQFEQYFAIGSGANFGLGAMHALYNQDFSAEEIARKAVEAAITFNIYCGEPIDLFRMENLPQRL